MNNPITTLDSLDLDLVTGGAGAADRIAQRGREYGAIGGQFGVRAGAIIGGAAGMPSGPLGVAAGVGLGALGGAAIGASAGVLAGWATQGVRELTKR